MSDPTNETQLSDLSPSAFVIEITHRKTGDRRYVCAVPVMRDDCEYEITPVDTLEEAGRYPYPTAEVAAAVVHVPGNEEPDLSSD